MEAVTEEYNYNIQGWLTSQSSPLFDMQLRYFDPLSGTGKARYAGDIAEWRWQHKGAGAPTATPANSYEFTYDGVGRLLSNSHKGASTITATLWGTPARTFTETMTYDRNGNITSLTRQGYHATSGSTSSVTDNLTYTYTGNKLTTLAHNNASGSVAASGSKTYTYDSNGNMSQNSRENLNYGYNYLNLLGNVKQGSTVKATYRWLADGTKAGVKTPAGTQGYEYLGSLVYKRDNTGLKLESASVGGGRIEVSHGPSGRTYTPNYQITDHLGSVRVVFTGASNVSARNDFYAFGKRAVNNMLPAGDDGKNRWLYNGKENQLTGDLRFLDFGARMYDSEIARMTTQDRFAEKYRSLSLYGYSAGNPANIIDYNGDSLWVSHKGQDLLYQNGELSQNGQEYTGKVRGFLKKAMEALSTIEGTTTGAKMISELQESTNNFTIQKNSENKFESSNVTKAYGQQHIAENSDAYKIMGSEHVNGGSGGVVSWNPSGANVQTVNGLSNDPVIVLGHEMSHAWDANRGLLNTTNIDGSPKSEWQAVYNENAMRRELGLPLRSHYGAVIVNGFRIPRTRMLMPTNQPFLKHVYP